VNTHSFDLKFVVLCPKFSRDSYVEFQEKLFSENFSQILVKPRLFSTKTPEISPYFLQFYSGSVLRWKKSHKYFHMCFAPGKEGRSINKSQKEDTGKKARMFCFSKNKFCSLSIWDILRLSPLVFWSQIFPRHSSLCLLDFRWYLSPKFIPQDSQ